MGVPGISGFGTYTCKTTKLVGHSGVLTRGKATIPNSGSTRHLELEGGAPFSNTGATSDLITLTLSSTAGEEDAWAATFDYIVTSDPGSTCSIEIGQAVVAFTQDSSGNRVLSSVSKFGDTRALDAGLTTFTVTFSATSASNVATVKVAVSSSPAVNGMIYFRARVMGGRRTASSAALASGVTAGT